MSDTLVDICPVHQRARDRDGACELCQATASKDPSMDQLFEAVRQVISNDDTPTTSTTADSMPHPAGGPDAVIEKAPEPDAPPPAEEAAPAAVVTPEPAMPEPAVPVTTNVEALEAQIRDMRSETPEPPEPTPEPAVETPEPAEAPPIMIDEGVAGDVPLPVLQRLIDEKRTVISLLGFRGAGKTWFMNRLKYQLFTSDDGFDCLPEHESQGESVERTHAISTHFFEPKQRGGDETPFYVVDMPGERFLGITRGELASRTRELLALKASKALMVVLPADEVLMGQKARAMFPRTSSTSETEIDFGLETTERGKRAKPKKPTPERLVEIMAASEVRLERFTASMSKLRARLSLLEGGAAPDVVARMTDADLAAHLDSKAYRPPVKPVFVALSKADILEQQMREIDEKSDPSAPAVNPMDLLFGNSAADLEALRDFDTDPLDTIRRFRPTLASAFSSFPWCKFDFVTAFRGHGALGVDATTMDYTLGRRGVSAVIRWMEWARDADTSLTPQQWRYVAAARSIRRFRDEGRFKAARKGGFR